MYHKPTPVAAAGVAHEVIFWTDDRGLLVGLNKRGGLPSWNQRLKQTLRRVAKVTPQSPPSRILKPGWIGRPTNWICHVDG